MTVFTDHLPELASSPTCEGVTIRDVLEMRSGIAYRRAIGNPWQQLRSHDARFYYTSNLNRELARMRRDDPPNERWDYKDSDTQVLAWVLARATGLSLAEQLEQRIWRRIGAEFEATWSLDRRGGNEQGATGFNGTAHAG